MLKIKDKLEKINDNFNVYMYDNGDWATAKIICNTLDDLVTLIKETSVLERD